MLFDDWFQINESNYKKLYRSTVNAFPYTQKRQNIVNEIFVEKLVYTPFLGVKTLFVKSNVTNQTNKNVYSPMILFKQVNYSDYKIENYKEVIGSEGKKYFLEKLSLDKDILLRCDCPDFRWRFSYYDHLDRSLYGNKPPKYESKGIRSPANPREMPGMCKHLMATINQMINNNLLI